MRLFTSGNFIKIDLDDGSPPLNFGKPISTFSETNSFFIVKEPITSRNFMISIASITANEWFGEDDSTQLSVSDVRDLLETNTNFNSASGGSGAELMQTGQTVSYATGDDADIGAGRDFNIADNPYNVAFRFTDRLGTQVYTDKIILDWSTWNGEKLLAYYSETNLVDINQNAANAEASTLTIGGLSGWHVCNARELHNAMHYGQVQFSNGLKTAPFNFIGARIWTSTPTNSTIGIEMDHNGQSYTTLKTTSANRRYAVCRYLTADEI